MRFRFDRHYDRYVVEVNASSFDLTVWVYRLSWRLHVSRPLPDCGKKWGKHDETVEHLPF